MGLLEKGNMCFPVAKKKFSVVILAAGRSKRMLSDYPKVVYEIGGKCILQHIIDTVVKINPYIIYIVYGDKGEIVLDKVDVSQYTIPIRWIYQSKIIGTGHAVNQVLPMLDDNEEVLVLCGDVPLISHITLRRLLSMKLECDVGLLTGQLNDPRGYGRIIRNIEKKIVSIIEDHAINTGNSVYKNICEVYSGIFITVVKYLKYWINCIYQQDIRGEFYLTNIFNVAYKTGFNISSITPGDIFEIIGINNKSDFVYLNRVYQRNQAKNLLLSGVLISDPNRFDLRGVLSYGRDVCIDINVIIEGNVSLGNRVKIGAGCILKNSIIADDVIIYPFSIIENSKVNLGSVVGPFARLRSNTKLKEHVCVGNFVELNNTQLGSGSKVKHLSYLGDSSIGMRVNIGAGSITCNYDGIHKHNTIIGDNVMIGADSQLIAPVTIGDSAVVGAGTTVTCDIPEGETIISRIRQFSIIKKK